MIKLKNILLEQGSVKKFVIQTPAPKPVLDIVRSTTPRGAAFILKSTDVLGEEPSMDTIINLLKLDERFGEQSIWAQGNYVYIFSSDLKDANRKTKFNVMIVPMDYIYTTAAGELPQPSGDIQKTSTAGVDWWLDDVKKSIDLNLKSKFSIGNANVYLQEDINAAIKISSKLLPINQLKIAQDKIIDLENKLLTLTEPPVQNQTVISGGDASVSKSIFKAGDIIPLNGAVIDTYFFKDDQFKPTTSKHQSTKDETAEFVSSISDKNTGQEYGYIKLGNLHWYVKIEDLNALKNPTSENKAQTVLKRLETAPIKLNTKSDDVAYIQDLIYRIGMADSNLSNKNDVPAWAAFRDAKSQYGTYGTRTKNFIDVVKDSAGLSTANSDITAEVLQLFLDAGKPLNITESRIKLQNLINEQFVIKPEYKTTQQTTTKTSTTNLNTTKSNLGSFHPIGTPTEKLDKTTVIKYGSKGEEVKRMQAALNAIMGLWKDLGNTATWLNTKLKPDGDFGPTTLKIHDFITTAPMNLQDWKATLQGVYDDWELTKKQSGTVSDQLVKDSKEMEKIWQDVYNVFTKNPDNYFSKFSSWYNDQEEKAADWMIKAFNKAWSKQLGIIQKRYSSSSYMNKNVQNILYVVNYISNELIKKGYSGRVPTKFYYIDKNKKWQIQNITFEWNYM